MPQQPNKLKKKKNQQLKRLNQLLQCDREIRSRGFQSLAGIDEAGRGPLAGPVVSAAVILPHDWSMVGIDDSKKLTPEERAFLYDEIKASALSIGIGCISEGVIDSINILQATYLAMKEAISNLTIPVDCLVIDAIRLSDCPIHQESIIHGDCLSFSIASASIIAKVTRDRLMIEYDRQYPHYGFAQHKGYGTRLHYESLQKHGPCPIHRRTFLEQIDNPTFFEEILSTGKPVEQGQPGQAG